MVVAIQDDPWPGDGMPLGQDGNNVSAQAVAGSVSQSTKAHSLKLSEKVLLNRLYTIPTVGDSWPNTWTHQNNRMHHHGNDFPTKMNAMAEHFAQILTVISRLDDKMVTVAEYGADQ